MVGCPDDEVLAAMLEQALDASMMGQLEVHLDSCDRCREVAALAVGSGPDRASVVRSIRASRSTLLAKGTPNDGVTLDSDPEGLIGATIAGRYRVETMLGRGGMGTVYRARDLTLDRDVAVKVHRARSGDKRLQREAVVMAQLAHPNVVSVFEVGTVDTWMYVAMEYVRGETLRAWIAAQPRPWREVLAMLVDTGRGLAAAHAAGLVHRDFKPDNVLVGADGRPRVSDFGLARVEHAGEPSAAVAPSQRATSLASPITAAGTVLGTPAYMPPEQYAGDPVDARGDQFAFGVVAWECLYGKRPFAGATLETMQLAILRGELELPARTQVPDRVRRVLARALSASHAERYPDMSVLLAELRRASRPRTPRYVALGTAGVLAAAAIAIPAGAKLVEHRRDTACAAEAAEVAGAFGTHGRTAVQLAFLASGAPGAQQTFDRMAGVLDRHAGALGTHTAAACRDRAASTRRACLAGRGAELGALVGALARADAGLVQRAPDTAWAILDETPCDDAHLVRASTATPDQLERLARTKALDHAGRYQEGIALATPLLDEARAQNDRGLELDVLLALGELRREVAPAAEVIPVYHQAQALAEELGRDFDAASALGALASLADELRDYPAAHRNLGLARAKLARLGGAKPLFEAKLLVTEAQLFGSEYRFAESEAAQRKAIAMLAPIVGDDHPLLGSAYGTLAQLLDAQRKTPEAVAASRRALAILEAALGPEHPTVAGAHMTLGANLLDAGELDAAHAQLVAADAVFVRVFGEVHPVRIGIHGRLGRLERQRDRHDAALAAFRTTLAMVEQVEGSRSLMAAGTRLDIAVTLAAQGKFDPAAAEAEAAVEITLAGAPDDLPRVSSALVDLATILIAGGHAARTIPIAERALAVIAKQGEAVNPSELSMVRFALARALWDTAADDDGAGANRRRARSLAEQALPAAPGDQARAQIETWLASHRPDAITAQR